MTRLIILLLCCVTLLYCGKTNEKKLFSIVRGSDAGIDFKNTIATSDTLNALSFEYIYNGGGVGIGDFNNDGLEDVVFGGNQVSTELYLNKGNLKFQKITKIAGLTTTRWITGVSVIDINQDGLADVHLCVGGKTTPENRRNLLFINTGIKNGVPVFEERSKEFGLDDDSYSTMAAFFDYDKDGDPDMYLVNNWLETFNRNNLRAKRAAGEAESTDKLYRNNGDNTFTNISAEAGILIEGYGLGVSIADINDDSWPDIYVSNDFMSNDLLWINLGNGKFENRIASYLNHQTHNGMGVDVADFNNDGLQDIFVVDMLPPGHERQKLMTPGQNFDHFTQSIKLGYEPQYMRNTLQLNRGEDLSGNVRFSEIAFLSGVAKTDWSWAPLFADFDNDGWKDLFIANGYRKDVTNLDFIFFGMQNGNPFGTKEARRTITNKEFDKVKDVKLNNYVFRNMGTLEFEDKTAEWGMDFQTFSNGAAYADFDNDGDLDLITNNIDEEVTIYENLQRDNSPERHFIVLRSADPASFNQKVWIYRDGKSQFQEITPFRGFQSTMSAYAHFGTGTDTKIDSVVIVWPDQARAVYHNLHSDTVLVFSRESAKGRHIKNNAHASLEFEEVSPIRYAHRETSPSDFKLTRTLVHELTKMGPCVATADVNNDNLDDFFIGGEYGISSKLCIQQSDGTFIISDITTDLNREDGAALFFDSDGDGDQDLYVAATCHTSSAPAGKHILYLNEKGVFTPSSTLPSMATASVSVSNADFDNDGDEDLFVGGHVKENQYPSPARSYLLRNDKGKFTDVTTTFSKGLIEPGLITSSLWADINRDGRTDLVLAGEWMAIRIFLNGETAFREATKEYGLSKTNGWWNCIKAADLNADGYPDIIAGNTGKNSFFNPDEEHPVKLFAKDYDNNGSVDPILSYYNPVEQDYFMIHNRLVLIDQIPAMKRRFETFTHYATTSHQKAFSKEELQNSLELNAYMLESVMLLNENGKRFGIKALPQIIQASTLNDMIIADLNGDKIPDIAGVGNDYNQETLFGRYDASFGFILLGVGNAEWEPMDHASTKFTADGDVRHIIRFSSPFGDDFALFRNNDSMKVLRIRKEPAMSLTRH
jgi:enediyne biosynthesis protein E4